MKKFFITVISVSMIFTMLFWYEHQKVSKELDKTMTVLTRVLHGTVANLGLLPKTVPSQEEVLILANKEAARLGYDIKSMNVSIDRYNTKWNEFISKDPSYLDSDPELRLKLKKGYWAVYYAPKKLQKGGDLWVFVDPKTGKIISHICGE